jgi:hypothetical protein
MHLAITAADTLATSKAVESAMWIGGWVVLLAIIAGIPIYFTQRRRKRGASK